MGFFQRLFSKKEARRGECDAMGSPFMSSCRTRHKARPATATGRTKSNHHGNRDDPPATQCQQVAGGSGASHAR